MRIDITLRRKKKKRVVDRVFWRVKEKWKESSKLPEMCTTNKFPLKWHVRQSQLEFFGVTHSKEFKSSTVDIWKIYTVYYIRLYYIYYIRLPDTTLHILGRPVLSFSTFHSTALYRKTKVLFLFFINQ